MNITIDTRLFPETTLLSEIIDHYQKEKDEQERRNAALQSQIQEYYGKYVKLKFNDSSYRFVYIAKNFSDIKGYEVSFAVALSIVAGSNISIRPSSTPLNPQWFKDYILNPDLADVKITVISADRYEEIGQLFDNIQNQLKQWAIAIV